jgi:hypothetical protein
MREALLRGRYWLTTVYDRLRVRVAGAPAAAPLMRRTRSARIVVARAEQLQANRAAGCPVWPALGGGRQSTVRAGGARLSKATYGAGNGENSREKVRDVVGISPARCAAHTAPNFLVKRLWDGGCRGRVVAHVCALRDSRMEHGPTVTPPWGHRERGPPQVPDQAPLRVDLHAGDGSIATLLAALLLFA